MKSFNEIMEKARQSGPKRIAVACAQDADVLKSVDMANVAGIADATLVGDREAIIDICKKLDIDYNKYDIVDEPDNQLAALLCARINGSPACFAACMDSSNEYKKISPLLRKGENEINQWADRHSVEHATVQAIQWLTRAPDRFSAAQFSPLLEHEKSSTQIINLLVWSGLCGWINRLKIALGETY